MDKVTYEKNLLREEMLAQRRDYVNGVSQIKRAELSIQIADNLFDRFNFPARSIVGSYFPLVDEVNVTPLNSILAEKGISVAFPRIEEDGYLSFRCPDHIDQLEVGSFGVRQPPTHFHQVFPEILLIPLIAFDKACHRLGYGKGHYDRVLKEARHSGDILAIGIAYDMQKRDKMPIDTFDQQLDYVVTDVQVYKAKTA